MQLNTEHLDRDPLGLGRCPYGLGCSSMGNMFGAVADAEVDAMVRELLQEGARAAEQKDETNTVTSYMDVAPWYGSAEVRLGAALQAAARDMQLPRSAFGLSTKVGRYRGPEGDKSPPTFDYSAAKTADSVAHSLRSLRVSFVDILFVHDIEFAPSLEQLVHETVPAMQALQKEGAVRYLGVSGYPLDLLLELVDLVPPGTFRYAMTYCHLNLHDSSLAEYVPAFVARGVTPLSAAPLSMGLLTDSGPPGWHPAKPELRAAARAAARLCRGRHGVLVEHAALHYSLRMAARSGDLVTVCGAKSAEELRANLAVCRGPPGPGLDAAVDASLALFRAALRPADRQWAANVGTANLIGAHSS